MCLLAKIFLFTGIKENVAMSSDALDNGETKRICSRVYAETASAAFHPVITHGQMY